MSATIAAGPWNVIRFETTAERLAYVFNGTERGRTIARDMESGVDYQVIAAGSGASCFSSMDATGLLDKTGGTMTGAITWALAANDDGSIIQRVTPKHAGVSVWYQRLGGATFGGIFDPVMTMGWNIGPDGLPVDPTHGTVAMNFEGFFAPEDNDDQEWHIIFGTKDGLLQTRAISTSSSQTTGYTDVTLTLSQFTVIDQHDNATPFVVYGHDSVIGAKRVTIGPGTPLYVGDGTVNASIVFNNSAASISSILGDSFQVAALTALPLKLYSSAGVINRTKTTIGSTGDMGATDVSLTIKQDSGQTGNMLNVSSTSGTGDLFAVTSGGLTQESVTASITASTTQTQGQGPLTKNINQISVCANINDTVTLPSAAAGMSVLVINSGAQTATVFPASGDDLGGGVNASTTIVAGAAKRFTAYDATNWKAETL